METKRGQEAPLQSARPCSRSRSAGLLCSLGFVAKDDRKVVTRGKILDAAVRQFGRHGFDNATVKAIAGLASVSPAIVHWYFGSKVVLYAEAVQVAADQFMAAMRRSNGPGETFTSLALHWITHFEDDTGTTRMLRALAGDHRHHAMDEAARRVHERFVDFWCAWLRERQDPSKQRAEADVTVLGTLIVAALTGLVATAQARREMLAAVLESLARWTGAPRLGVVDDRARPTGHVPGSRRSGGGTT